MSRKSGSETASAIIIGGHVNGLGVVRSLAPLGVPVLILDTDLAQPTMRTRYGRKMAVPELSGSPLIESLRKMRGEFACKPVLFPTQEAGLATLSSAYPEIGELYRIALPPQSIVQKMLDKNLFQAEAERLGFLVPRSVQLTRGQSPTGMEQLRYPCVLKPAAKDEVYAHHFSKAYRIASPSEAEALWARMEPIIETAIVQEWIDGGDSDIYFCLQYRPPSGADATSFCGRKTLQWPPLVGGTAVCVPAPEFAQELTETTSRFFGQTGVTGLCSMEYKRDPRDRKFYMVEPTVGRTDYQEEIATLNGVNIPLAAYSDLAGTSHAPTLRKTSPAGWRDPFGYHNALVAGGADPVPTLHPDLKLVDAYFRLGDPMPYLATKLSALRGRGG